MSLFFIQTVFPTTVRFQRKFVMYILCVVLYLKKMARGIITLFDQIAKYYGIDLCCLQP
jgi:hypothetical protein